MNLYREAFLHIKSFPNAFWVVILATFINQSGNMALVFLMLYATQSLHLTVSQGATAFAVVSGSMLVSSLLSGSLIDRAGAKQTMIYTAIMNGLILLCIPLAHNYYLLILLCFFWGLFFGAYRPAGQTIVSFFSIGGSHRITYSVYRLVINLGMSIGPAIGGYLATHSFHTVFVANGVANILAGIILIIGLAGFRQNTSPPATKNTGLSFFQFDKKLGLFLVAVIPVSIVFFQHESTLPVYLSQDLNLPVSFYGLLFTINTLMIVFLELLINIATIHWSYRLNLIIGTAFITAGFLGVYFATAMWHIIITTVLWTFGEMFLYPSANSYIAEIAPEGSRGSYISLFSAATNLGMLAAPIIGALIIENLGTPALWLACGVFGIISIQLFWLLKEQKNIRTGKLQLLS